VSSVVDESLPELFRAQPDILLAHPGQRAVSPVLEHLQRDWWIGVDIAGGVGPEALRADIVRKDLVRVDDAGMGQRILQGNLDQLGGTEHILQLGNGVSLSNAVDNAA